MSCYHVDSVGFLIIDQLLLLFNCCIVNLKSLENPVTEKKIRSYVKINNPESKEI